MLVYVRPSNEAFLLFQTSFKGSGQGALYCAHRTSTFLSCAFCEQEGHLAAPFSSFLCFDDIFFQRLHEGDHFTTLSWGNIKYI
jgi:hypothetical protein